MNTAAKGQTYKLLRLKREVPESSRELSIRFSRISRKITEALKENELTVEQLSGILGMSKNEILFYLMSMLKYGMVQTGKLDDMDEYFTYKLKRDDRS